MKSKRLFVLSATALALVSIGNMAWADGGCSSASLRGSYAFSAVGEVIGILDDVGVHPFKTPSVLNDVAIVRFDGVSHFSRTDFGTINGVPKTPDFNSDQSGDYTVNANCTGTMTIRYTSGVVLDLMMVIADNGTVVKAVIGTETVPASTPALDGTTCGTSCKQAVRVSFDGKKVFDARDRDWRTGSQ
ncbi:hypothetical protein AWB79_02003 [Caballeronia hypogeia]|uniref:Uncharacterized protein n=1 Tax=Caballeronia hypogeia TaxID=1777140 RepID=A0A158A684_9BURK|nr:hypothetical protein [Caballeronia hypogeia]SAK53280.1 hypothetical protein AWB79_02003 [Caballeronia hypogeia]